jgi:riboflavin biosynthesis pyrimidine reductase
MVFHGGTLTRALEELGKLGISSVLMESGGRLFSHAIANGLIDEVILYVAPFIGGHHNRLMPADNIVASLEGMKVKRIGRDLRISGVPRKAE